MCPVNAPLGVKRKERTKMNENIRVGTRGTIKVGRNEVKVKVVGKAPNGGWKVKTESGKEMTVKNITTEAKAEAPAEKKAAPERKPAAPAGERKLSLVNAAAAVLERSDEPMTVRRMIDAAKEQKLWEPGAGKTPEQTLYSAIMREIKAKGDASRFVKDARGHFRAK